MTRKGRTHKGSAPSALRRAVLKLLAGSVAGASLGRFGTDAVAAGPPGVVGDAVMALEFDGVLRSRVLARRGGGWLPLTAFGASETLRLADGRLIEQFGILGNRREQVVGAHGRGVRHVVHGRATEGIEKEVGVIHYDRHPGFALTRVTYRNAGSNTVMIGGWVNGAHVLQPAADGSRDFWSFSGASHEDRRDWVQPVRAGFDQRNFMGMNATDYGGGTPVVDVWRRDWGMAVGHVGTVPELLALPLTLMPAGVRIAVEHDQAVTLAPGESFSTVETFVSVHRGDYFKTLETYSKVLGERGMVQAKVPAAGYEPIWCAWGYERDFTVEHVIGTLPKAKELGLTWAVVDDGWQTSEGDWYLDPKKFPRGEADMIGLVKAIKDAGMKPKLWVAPLAVDPGTDLHRDHADMLLLDKNGKPHDITWWDSLYLCPAYPKTIERSKALVRKMMREWGYAGLKIDGQHLNGVAPCYNPAHKHARPEESVEKLQDFWKVLFDEAMAIDPQAVIEICPCGTSYAFHNMPYMNQTVASDPLSSWQIRHKGKTIKALMGPRACYSGDHVELSDQADDFASTVGVGGIVSTKFTWPADPKPKDSFLLTPEKEAQWRKWIALHNEKRLAEGEYLGQLYDIGFDKPEAHAVRQNGRLYYAFYAGQWNGPVELRGLGQGSYKVVDIWTGKMLGSVTSAASRLPVAFERFLLLEATPSTGARG